MQICHYSTVQLFNNAGHQQLVNDVKFSPDARLVASASFDKSIRVGNNLEDFFLVEILIYHSKRCGVARQAGS